MDAVVIFLMITLMFFGMGFLIGAIIVPIIMRMMWPKDIVSLEMREGKSPMLKIDRGKQIDNKKTGERYLKLKKYKSLLKPQNLKYVLAGEKGRDAILLYNYAKDHFTPINVEGIALNPDGTGVNFSIVPEDIRNWAYLMRSSINNRFPDKSTLERFLPIIAIIGILIGSGIFFIFMAQALTNVLSTGASINAAGAQNIARQTELMESLVIAMGGGGGSTPMPITPPS